MKQVQEYLKQMGLSDIESKLYMGLLETGSSTVMELANHVGIKRITAHFNIENLVQKGLVTETRKGARRQIVAEDPEKLSKLLEDKEAQLVRMKESLPAVIQSIVRAIPKAKTADEVDIRYYEGKKMVAQIYADSLKSNEVYSFVNLDKYYEIYPDTGDLFWNALKENPKRTVKDLAVDSPLSRKISTGHPQYFCKFIPPSEFFSGFDILIYDNMVAVIQLEQENTSATVIDSKLISMSFKALHNTMWGLLGGNTQVTK